VLGATDPDARLHLSILLRLPGERRLAAVLARSADRFGPSRPLTAATFGACFGLTRARIAVVVRELRNLGFDVLGSDKQRTAVEVDTSATVAQKTFGVHFRDLADERGRRFHLPVGSVHIPARLATDVVGVAGLSNRPRARAYDVPATGLRPADLVKAYGIVPLRQRRILGQGQTIAVLSFDALRLTDLREFETATGTRGGVTRRVLVAGGATGAGPEAALDVETIRGIAPRATIENFEAPYDGPASFGRALERIVPRLRPGSILSVSNGVCDVRALEGGQQWLSRADRLLGERQLEFAAARGINVFVSSGDAGAYDCQWHLITDLRLATDWPGDSPWVVSVGGTRLWTRVDGAYHEEAGWEDVLSTMGSGGGLNPLDGRPHWQKGSGVQNEYSNGKRQLPDVAATADPDSGYFVVFDGKAGRKGGTSGSAPFWAGVCALVQQYARRSGVPRLPFFPPLLYRIGTEQTASSFHDVVRGGNRYYRATGGWDYVTGLGSPDAWNLARAVSKDIVRIRRSHATRP
jgi:kumamolisin